MKTEELYDWGLQKLLYIMKHWNWKCQFLMNWTVKNRKRFPQTPRMLCGVFLPVNAKDIWSLFRFSQLERVSLSLNSWQSEFLIFITAVAFKSILLEKLLQGTLLEIIKLTVVEKNSDPCQPWPLPHRKWGATQTNSA